eukprot:scaffold323_cov91-Cyclotella_meneghiniana.AAC.12
MGNDTPKKLSDDDERESYAQYKVEARVYQKRVTSETFRHEMRKLAPELPIHKETHTSSPSRKLRTTEREKPTDNQLPTAEDDGPQTLQIRTIA